MSKVISENQKHFQAKMKFIDDMIDLYKPCVTQQDTYKIYENQYLPKLKTFSPTDQVMIDHNIHRIFKLKQYDQEQLEQDIIDAGGLCNFSIDQLKDKLKVRSDCVFNNIVFDDSVILKFFSYFKGVTKDTMWKWGGVVSDNGYGIFNHKRKRYLIHRTIYVLCVMNIPIIQKQTFQICHSCDIKLCGNIFHLWIGTNDDNVQDKVQKNRQSHVPLILSLDQFDKIIDDIQIGKYNTKYDIINNENISSNYLKHRFNKHGFNSNKYTLKEVKKIVDRFLVDPRFKLIRNEKDMIFDQINNYTLVTLNDIEEEFNISRPTLYNFLFKDYDEFMETTINDQIKALKTLIYGKAGLSWNIVYDIKFNYLNTSIDDLVKKFNISQSMVYKIINNKTWKHVTKESKNSLIKMDFAYGKNVQIYKSLNKPTK